MSRVDAAVVVDLREIIATDEEERFGARSRNAAKQP
jgi:hypothetical protein